MASVPIATYEEVKDLPNHPEKLLIDVREPSEIAETGSVPTAINIPQPEIDQTKQFNRFSHWATLMSQFEVALKLSSDEFKAKYHHEKPATNQEVIFHCKLGGRAQKAAEQAVALGFNNVKNYKGSWTEWAQKEKL